MKRIKHENQQYISEAKSCSRRETDRLIKAGRVAINGEICTHGALVAMVIG